MRRTYDAVAEEYATRLRNEPADEPLDLVLLSSLLEHVGPDGVVADLFPRVEFREGDLLDLPAADGEFSAAVALYTIIHLDPTDPRRAFVRGGGTGAAPFGPAARVVPRRCGSAPPGRVLGHDVDLDFRFLHPAQVTGPLEAAGFTVQAQLERAHYPHEAQTRRAYLLARRC